MVMKRLRRHTVFTNLALIGVEVGGASLAWFIFNGRQTFESLHSYFFICASIVIASVAALNSILASSIASEAQRPFLYRTSLTKTQRVGKYITLGFNIKNSGSLPAEDVQTDINFFDKDEKATERNRSDIYEPPILESESSSFLLFPNSDYYQSIVLDLEQADDLKLWNDIKDGKTKCRIRITYTSLGRKHETMQTEELVKRESETDITTKPIPPQKWK
jgi:hypothetical protein